MCQGVAWFSLIRRDSIKMKIILTLGTLRKVLVPFVRSSSLNHRCAARVEAKTNSAWEVASI